MKNNLLEIMCHSCEHLMAAAIMKLWPKARRGVGPAIENGFYQDIEIPGYQLTPGDISKIEKEMRKIIKAKLPFQKSIKPIDEAIKYEKSLNQIYKVEILEELKENGERQVTYYQTGVYLDLCHGPHVADTSKIGFFKIDKLAGAYWRGDEKQTMLQRVYGLCFPTKEELDKFLWQREEAKKRDHRILGKKLELFMFDDEIGQGLPLWLPKGAFIRHKIMEFAFNTYLKRGYQPVSGPHIASEALWKHSGHLEFYKEGMYSSFGIDNEQYRLKPMNCPMHVKMYKVRPRSYKELPLRWTEMGTVYRYEKSGVLHGLTRVRGFTQDDAHIICREDQLHSELVEALKLTLYILTSFGFKDFEMNLSVRDPENKDKFIGSDKAWKKAETSLKEAMAGAGHKNYVLDVGGAVFYGPKVDVKIADSLGRKWQLSTIQVDFNLPSRFEMEYIGKDSKEHTPFMIHRALLGSLERFMGVYIEHTGGNFPLWLSPIQVQLIPIADRHVEYTNKIYKILFNNDIRVEMDTRSESMQAKIRDATLQKIPYMGIIGDKEKDLFISVRTREGKDLGQKKVNEFLDILKLEIQKKN